MPREKWGDAGRRVVSLAPSRIAILRYIATDTWHGLHIRARYTANFGRPVNTLKGAPNCRIKSFR